MPAGIDEPDVLCVGDGDSRSVGRERRHPGRVARPVAGGEPEGVDHPVRRDVDRHDPAVAGADRPERPAVLRHGQGIRRRGAEVPVAGQVDAARGRVSEVEDVHHRTAVTADVEREQQPAVRRRCPCEREAPDRRRAVRVLERSRHQSVRGKIVEPHLVAVLELLDQVELVAAKRVERPRVPVEDDRARRIGREQHERWSSASACAAGPPDSPPCESADQAEAPCAARVASRKRVPWRDVVAGDEAPVPVDERVAGDDSCRKPPACRSLRRSSTRTGVPTELRKASRPRLRQ